LVNQVFTKSPLSQRTRFFVAERRSSLLGRGALVVMTKAPLFSHRGGGLAVPSRALRSCRPRLTESFPDNAAAKSGR
jgi:hypothetical protein